MTAFNDTSWYDPPDSFSQVGGSNSAKLSALLGAAFCHDYISEGDEDISLRDQLSAYQVNIINTTPANLAKLTNDLHELILSSIVSGFLTEYIITDPNYPYFSNQNYTFRLERLNGSTLRLLATGPIYFNKDIFNDTIEHIVTFPQQDIPLSTITAASSDGIRILYLGINRVGAIRFSENSLAIDNEYVQLGLIIVKQIAGVITFQDDTVSPVLTLPNLAGVDNYARTINPLSTDIHIHPAGASLNLHRDAGNIVAECNNWAGTPNVHVRETPEQNPAQFRKIHAGTLSGTSLDVLTTVVDPANYWNGSAIVAVGGSANAATVQRFLMTVNGALLVQYGEQVYPTLTDAVNGADIAPFTDIFPATFAQEISRFAVRKTATDLSDTDQAIFIKMGGGGGGSGGATGPQGAKGDPGIIIYQEAEIVDPIVIPGPRGLQGIQGPTGNTGPAGIPGVDGIDGTDGINGRDGTNGTNGIDGKDGRNGVTILIESDINEQPLLLGIPSNPSPVSSSSSVWLQAFAAAH